MIFSGIVVDFLAVICMCTADNRKMSKNEDLLKDASGKRMKAVLLSVAAGILCGCLAMGGGVLARIFGNPDSASAVCFTSLILLQLCLCIELMRGRYGFFDGLTNIYIISAIITVEYLVLSAVFPVFFSDYLTGTIYTSGIVICLIPTALFIVICTIIRGVENALKKKKEAAL